MVPHTGISPIKKQIAEGIRKNRKALSEWYLRHAQQTPPPFYSSVDLRDSGHKIVPVDSNLYPAGFNNICPDDIRAAAPVFKRRIIAEAEARGQKIPKRILILPEAHTTNTYYIENLYYLHGVIKNAGFEVEIGWFPQTEGSVKLVSVTSKELTAYPIQVTNGILTAGAFKPDFILLNNDFSSGYPKILDEVTQPIVPSHTLGWHSRKKGEHFVYYNQLAAEFARIIGIEPWALQIDTETVGPVNFNEDLGTLEVADAVKRVLARTEEAYRAHGITQKPFAFVKNNAGTYGMGIMVVHTSEEVAQMNRRAKNKMSVGKNKLPIDSVVVQEGIPTATLVDRLAAEPVIYLVGCELIGGFLRTNSEKGVEDNLNSQGMVFRKLCMSDLQSLAPADHGDDHGDNDEEDGPEPLLELVYGAVARISALATGQELAHHMQSHALPQTSLAVVPCQG